VAIVAQADDHEAGRAALYRRGLSLLEGRRLSERALELDPDRVVPHWVDRMKKAVDEANR